MQIGQMSVGLLRQVIDCYLNEAFEDCDHPPVALPEDDGLPLSDALGCFADESREEGAKVHRYVLRLGNARYPFMKLVLQEHLIEDEFFFGVDTHDGMFDSMLNSGDKVERAALDGVKAYNADVKQRVEQAWRDHQLPTAAVLKGLVEMRPARRHESTGLGVLLVDDDVDIAETVSLLLRASGYEVEVQHDGMAAVEHADAERHDLILMDNEMPRLTGFEACRELKAREATKDIPVLIATAGKLTLQQLDAADGFLVKPFRIDLLLSMMDHLLSRARGL